VIFHVQRKGSPIEMVDVDSDVIVGSPRDLHPDWPNPKSVPPEARGVDSWRSHRE